MSIHSQFIVAALSVALAGTISFSAAPPAKDKTTQQEKPGKAKKAADRAAEAASLKQAYSILESADHDYKGHRVRAMHAIEAACKALGSEIAGDGRNREKQAISDSQLRNAASVVANVRATAQGDNQARVVKHLDVAIKELNIALSIK